MSHIDALCSSASAALGTRSAFSAVGLIGGALLLALCGCTQLKQAEAQKRAEHGQELLKQDQLEQALVEFEAAVAMEPSLAVAHSGMGVIYRRMGEYARAIECFANALRHNPNSFDDSINLAQLYHFTKRLSDAVEAYLHACDLRPGDFNAQLNLGVCYWESGDLNQAAERYQKAVEIDPDSPHPYVNLGIVLDAQGKYYEAIEAYKRALERDNHQPAILVNLAYTYLNQDRVKMAQLALEQALKLDPELPSAHEALGFCYFRSQDYPKAEEAYATALQYNPRLPNAHAFLGSINMLKFLADPTDSRLRDRALESWHRSLELSPDQPKVRQLIAKYQPKQTEPDSVLLSDTAQKH